MTFVATEKTAENLRTPSHAAPSFFHPGNGMVKQPAFTPSNTTEVKPSGATQKESSPYHYLLLVPSWKPESNVTIKAFQSLANEIKRRKLKSTIVLTSKPDEALRNTYSSICEEIIEPNTPPELDEFDPRILMEECDYYFAQILKDLHKFTHIVAVNGETSTLAKYLLENMVCESKAKLVTLNIDDDDLSETCTGEEMLQTMSIFRSSVLIFSIGRCVTERWKALVKNRDEELGQKYIVLESGKSVSKLDANVLARVSTRILQEVNASKFVH